ncbi:hypothetical protein ABZY20_35005 [Streptomyces sp. NPDC006624]|uniref:hypothetical protein n=1 Tax=unclassified Streptomyces TaxID=2593676 RepID=UPI0033BE828D
MARLIAVTGTPARRPARTGENHSTWEKTSARIDVMFRHAFALAASVVTDAPKAAVVVVTAVADGARS